MSRRYCLSACCCLSTSLFILLQPFFLVYAVEIWLEDAFHGALDLHTALPGTTHTLTVRPSTWHPALYHGPQPKPNPACNLAPHSLTHLFSAILPTPNLNRLRVSSQVRRFVQLLTGSPFPDCDSTPRRVLRPFHNTIGYLLTCLQSLPIYLIREPGPTFSGKTDRTVVAVWKRVAKGGALIVGDCWAAQVTVGFAREER
jgi:hypothetical protein